MDLISKVCSQVITLKLQLNYDKKSSNYPVTSYPSLLSPFHLTFIYNIYISQNLLIYSFSIYNVIFLFSSTNTSPSTKKNIYILNFSTKKIRLCPNKKYICGSFFFNCNNILNMFMRLILT